MKIMKTIMKAATIGLASILLNTAAASAHAHLLGAKVLATTSNQSDIALTFSEALVLQLSNAKIVCADGAVVNLNALTLSNLDPKILVAGINAKLGAGTYFVDWKAVSNDGHKMTGRTSVEVAP
jgi:methionine-rich copper-binding protein CopC